LITNNNMHKGKFDKGKMKKKMGQGLIDEKGKKVI